MRVRLEYGDGSWGLLCPFYLGVLRIIFKNSGGEKCMNQVAH